MTTYTQFNTALSNLSPTGVVKKLAAPPASLNTADLPTAWVQGPTGEEPPLTFNTIGGWHAMKAQYVVALKPTAQSTLSDNYAATLTMMDAVTAALDGTAPTAICESPVSYTIRAGIVTLAGEDFWAVIAEVSGSG